MLSENGLLLASVEIGVAVLTDAGGEGREEEAAAGLHPLPDEEVVKDHGGEHHQGYLRDTRIRILNQTETKWTRTSG